MHQKDKPRATHIETNTARTKTSHGELLKWSGNVSMAHRWIALEKQNRPTTVPLIYRIKRGLGSDGVKVAPVRSKIMKRGIRKVFTRHVCPRMKEPHGMVAHTTDGSAQVMWKL